MQFKFAVVKADAKIKTLKNDRMDCVQFEHFTPGYPYFIILTDRYVPEAALALYKKDIDKSGIKSYMILCCLNQKDPPEESTDALISIESEWRKYLTFNDTKCDAIISMGWAIRVLTHEPNVDWLNFMDDKFNPTRFWGGSKFVNGPECWVYPVAADHWLYPFQEKLNELVNMTTRFWHYQLKSCQNDLVDKKTFNNIFASWFDTRPYNIIDCDTKEKVSAALKELFDSEYLAYDTETDGFNFRENKLGTLQLSNDGINTYFFDWKNVDKRLLNKCFETAKNIIGHNAKFDHRFLFANGLNKKIEYNQDSMLLVHLLNSDRPKGLKENVIFNLNGFIGYDDELEKAKKRLKVDNYLQIPREILKTYSALDSLVTWRLFMQAKKHCEYLDKHFPNEKNPAFTMWKWYDEVMIPNAQVVTQSEFKGVYFNHKQFEISSAYINEQIKLYEDKLHEIWGPKSTNVEFGSTKQVGDLFRELGWPEVRLAVNGSFSTAEEDLNIYERKGYPGIKELKELRSWKVAYNTFIGGYTNFMQYHPEDDTYRIHASCNLFGTESHRHSMTQPNFQQVPAHGKIAVWIKKLFGIPNNDPENWLLSNWDFSGLQFRLACCDIGLEDKPDKIMFDIYGDKGHKDAHSQTAYNVFCEPIGKNIIEIEDESGKKIKFFEDQKIKVIRKEFVDEDAKEIIIEGKDFLANDEFLEKI